MQSWLSHLKSLHNHNISTLRSAPLAELSGSLGDLGTLLPLLIALTLQNSIDLPSTLVFSGLTNILTGIFFGIPLPVQPMKAIAAVAISERFDRETTAAAGLVMGMAVLVLSATGLLGWLHRVVPVAVVRGIQVGAGLSLVISAGSSLIKPLGWVEPEGWWDNRVWAVVAFGGLIVASVVPRVPYALVVFVVGLLMVGIAQPGGGEDHEHFSGGLWHPVPFVPSRKAWRVGAIDAAIPQLPLTTLNSVLAVVSLSSTLFPSYPPTPSTTSIGFSVAIANLIGCWFGAMPICHGSGGLAGQYRFGARSGSSIIILGTIKLVLGLFVGEAIVPVLQRFPKSLLGIMVLAAGVELSKVAQNVGETSDLWAEAEGDEEEISSFGKYRQTAEQQAKDRWMVMLITVAGCLAFKNDAVGFIAGLVWHWGLRVPELLDRMRHGHRGVQLRRDSAARAGNLFSSNDDEGRTEQSQYRDRFA